MQQVENYSIQDFYFASLAQRREKSKKGKLLNSFSLPLSLGVVTSRTTLSLSCSPHAPEVRERKNFSCLISITLRVQFMIKVLCR